MNDNSVTLPETRVQQAVTKRKAEKAKLLESGASSS